MNHAATPRLSLHAGLLTLSMCLPLGQHAGATDISDRPLISSQTLAKPNIMFILDNSGSMDWRYMPDDASGSSRYALLASQCNGAAFNPEQNYEPPVTPDGRLYPNMSLTAAWSDGFLPTFASGTTNTSSSTVSMNVAEGGTSISVAITSGTDKYMGYATGNVVVLQSTADPAHWILGTVTAVTGTSSARTLTINATFSTAIQAGSFSSWKIGKPSTSDLTVTNTDDSSDPLYNYYYSYSGSQTPLAWTYDASGTRTSSTFNNECRSTVGNSPGSSVFTKVMVSTLSTELKQRYANWHSYYRKRILLMRTTSGRALQSLNSDYRVGFTSINDNTNGGSDTNYSVTPKLGAFADVADFGDTQKMLLFSNLYGAIAYNGTPLRTALSKIGRYYGNAISGQTDPIQYACQRNYALLSTDGYWNDAVYNARTDRDENLNPVRLDGTTAIGNQDNTEVAPMYDGSNDSTTVEQRYIYTQTGTCGRRNNRLAYTTVTQRRTTTTDSNGTTPGEWSDYATDTNGCDNSVPSPSPSTPTVVSRTVGGGSNTLADVAQYYYKTDLRTTNCTRTEGTSTIQLCENIVPTSKSGADKASHQHMTTYTLGLGLSGTLTYDRNYLTQTSGDYKDIVNGTQVWPALAGDDLSSIPEKIDDLWHAAVNGRGRYFSASDPQTLSDSLKDAFEDIKSKEGAGASAASSSLRPVLGTDQVFLGSYTTQVWSGELEARTITKNATTGVISVDEANRVWSAQSQLNDRTYTSRSIYYLRKVTSGTAQGVSLGAFDYDTLGTDDDATALTGYFSSFCSKSPAPAQCTTLTSTQQTSASGANLVNFLRGDRSNETSNEDSPLFRRRASVLGDMVDAAPIFVGKPPFNYTDTGYTSYINNQASRCPVVYAAANDGMLHAFSAKPPAPTATGVTDPYSSCPTAGREVWAYVPRSVMSQMYRLADTNYANNHRFFVNGSPIVGDISITTAGDPPTITWKTILVGGLGAGGRGYYALDVSNPSSPAPLWEFTNGTDSDLGLTYGNPIITKVKDSSGTLVWAVVFSSGLNNGGNGYLYILNAHTGSLMYKIPTNLANGDPAGTADQPNGLSKINVWVDNDTDNTAKRFYGGDQLGNLWRFDAENLTAPATGKDTRALQLAVLKTSSTAFQPISTRPELAELSYGGSRHAVVFVGTGRYLGQSDLANTAQQSIYAIKDPLTSSGWGSIRGNTGLISQTVSLASGSTTTKVATNSTVNWSASSTIGWQLDLPTSGERMITDMSLQYNTLSLATAVPENNACSGAGSSWLYQLNIYTGSYTQDNTTTNEVAKKLDGYLALGLSAVAPDGEAQTGLLVTGSDRSLKYEKREGHPKGGTLRRTAWRELLE